jgi:hypothetical protein
MPWLGGRPPSAPLAAHAEPGDDDGATLLLGAGDSTVVAWWLVQVRDSEGRWSMAVLPATTRQLPLAKDGVIPDVVAVTAIDRVGQSSVRTILRLRRGR